MLEMTATAQGASDFLVRSKEHIYQLCNGISEQKARLSISFSCVDSVAASSLLYVDQRSNRLLLECSPQWQRIQHIIDMHHSDTDYGIVVTCAYDNSKIQFQCGIGVTAKQKGTPVVGLSIPEVIWRFQRRCDPRQKPPGVKVTLNMGFLDAEAELADLGMAGIGMFTCDRAVRVDVGEVLHDCTIAVPGLAQIVVDLMVCHQSVYRTINGNEVMLIGCKFIGLKDRMRQLIAHYLDGLAET